MNMETKWIRFKDEKPEERRLFIMRIIGAELNTDWRLKVWDTNVVSYMRIDTSYAEYMYIDNATPEAVRGE